MLRSVLEGPVHLAFTTVEPPASVLTALPACRGETSFPQRASTDFPPRKRSGTSGGTGMGSGYAGRKGYVGSEVSEVLLGREEKCIDLDLDLVGAARSESWARALRSGWCTSRNERRRRCKPEVQQKCELPLLPRKHPVEGEGGGREVEVARSARGRVGDSRGGRAKSRPQGCLSAEGVGLSQRFRLYR